MSIFDEAAALTVARAARGRAYAPYSKFKVGAAVVLASGKIVSGCNIENSSFGGTVCAERTAIWSGITNHGESDIRAIVVVAEGDGAVVPCAMCLQVMAEFLKPDTPIILADMKTVQDRTTFKELLPRPFGPQAF